MRLIIGYKHHGNSIIILSLSLCLMIWHLVSEGIGISFVYKAVEEKQENISSFEIKNIHSIHEFNYVYLKGTPGKSMIDGFEGSSEGVF